MSTSAKVKLTATARDNAAELFVIDSKLDLVGRGIGSVTTLQPPGIYKLKVRAGQATHEELVVLEKEPVHRVLDHLCIPSAAPLDRTGQSHEYHQEAAIRESKKALVTLGKGASIFVFARDWTPQGKQPASGHHPAEKLKLRSIDGADLVDFQKKSHVDLTKDPWAACRVDLAPGPYRLAVAAATGEEYEMTVIAQRGWQTQVFLLQRDDVKWQRGRRPDLAGASVSMTRSNQFSLGAEDDRLAELARLALVDRRKVLTDELNQMLRGKFNNPLLGILGGHLILRQAEPDRGLLQVVVANLRRQVFRDVPHPDVEALALAAGENSKCDFAVPPMLRAGWNIVVERSVEEPRLVPGGSLGSRIGPRVTNQDPWLIWRSLPNAKEDWADDYLDEFREVMETARQSKGQKEVGLQSHTVRKLFSQVQSKIGGLSANAGDVALKSLRDFIASSSITSSAVDQLAKQLAPALRLPPATVAQLIAKAYPEAAPATRRRGEPPVKR